MKLLLLKIGAISVMVPHNLLTTLSSESKTEKEKEESAFTILFIYGNLLYVTFNIVINTGYMIFKVNLFKQY